MDLFCDIRKMLRFQSPGMDVFYQSRMSDLLRFMKNIQLHCFRRFFRLKIIPASIVSTFAFIGAMGAANPCPAFAVAFGSWFLLIWSLTPSGGTKQDRREREQAMEDLMGDWEGARRNRY